MDWIKKHADTVIILSSLLLMMLWVNKRFNDIHLDLEFIAHELEKIKVALISSDRFG